jgi:hypothetical protein
VDDRWHPAPQSTVTPFHSRYTRKILV